MSYGVTSILKIRISNKEKLWKTKEFSCVFVSPLWVLAQRTEKSNSHMFVLTFLKTIWICIIIKAFLCTHDFLLQILLFGCVALLLNEKSFSKFNGIFKVVRKINSFFHLGSKSLNTHVILMKYNINSLCTNQQWTLSLVLWYSSYFF